jgi:hypothetical protein
MAAHQSPAGGWKRETRAHQILALVLLAFPRLARQALLRTLRPASWLCRPAPAPRLSRPGPRSARPPRWERQASGAGEILLDRDSGDVVVLNPTARMVLELTRTGADADEVTRALSSRFPAIDPARIRVDVAAAIGTLAGIGLIDRSHAS